MTDLLNNLRTDIILDTRMTTPSEEKKETEIVVLVKKRLARSGESAIGVSVLSVRGRIGSQSEEEVDLRIDSLTGEILQSEVEAYIVKGMTVPILLGEDYQLNYQLGVTRNVETGSKITFLGSDYSVEAKEVESYPGKAHRIAKEGRRWKKKQQIRAERLVRADTDYRIKAYETRVVGVVGHFAKDQDWLVEGRLMATTGDTFLSVPKTLINARSPSVPVSNLSDPPRLVRKGEILGTVIDPAERFNKPSDEESLRLMEAKSALFSHFIQLKSQATSGTATEEGKEDAQSRVRTDFGSGVPPSEENAKQGVHVRDARGRVPDGNGELLEPTQMTENQESEEYGPKTTAMPDNTVYPSSEMKELLDIGSLPDEFKERAWDMLSRRIKVFGFDGRLGHVDVKARVRIKEDQDPIAVPMYSSSPEKRRIIDEQLDKWFEQGVIEPSVSPWSAPVVIAYRNGKPRFCMDY
ncbi:hypothetical protein C8R45DRAFT_931015 [Mycena sanguinolenta]|nr:hypothetical protein C8R45DRAFT_931015 [Mycena sanguinolenta]